MTRLSNSPFQGRELAPSRAADRWPGEAHSDSPVGRARSLGLPRAPLPEALAICLDLLDDDPGRFAHAAITWHGRFCAHTRGLTMAGAQTSLAALAALPGPYAVEHAKRLATISRAQGLVEVAAMLDCWAADRIEARGARTLDLARAARSAEGSSLHPTAAWAPRAGRARTHVAG